MSAIDLLYERDEYNTLHAVHFFMTCATFFAWTPVWIMCAWANKRERDRIDRKLMMSPEARSLHAFARSGLVSVEDLDRRIRGG